ncbi:hypothetical protein, partial [Streptomyces calidiresistens]
MATRTTPVTVTDAEATAADPRTRRRRLRRERIAYTLTTPALALAPHVDGLWHGHAAAALIGAAGAAWLHRAARPA